MNSKNLNTIFKGKKPINVSIDKEARAVYFKISDDEILGTDRFNESLSVDYGKDDKVIGVEIIRVSKIELLLKKALKDISFVIPKRALTTH